jgi:hypothetical protein
MPGVVLSRRLMRNRVNFLTARRRPSKTGRSALASLHYR